MALVPIKTASTTGYCDCIHGCYELASLRDEDTGKGYCPRCAKEHLDLNKGIGIPQPAPSKIAASNAVPFGTPADSRACRSARTSALNAASLKFNPQPDPKAAASDGSKRNSDGRPAGAICGHRKGSAPRHR